MIPMLTGLKVLSLECKCAFWRPEHNTKGDPMELNLEGLEMQKWNILTDMDQRLDEKNVVIYLVIKFALRIMVINISKIAHFIFFFSDGSPKIVPVWAKYLSTTERACWVFSENGMVYRLWSCRLLDIEGRNTSEHCWVSGNSLFSRLNILLMLAQNPRIYSIF